MRTILLNAQICAQDSQLKPATIVIDQGLIQSLDPNAKLLPNDQVIDVKQALVTPGLIDLHVHLREPGFTHKETIKTGTQAAARGGFTTICAMPNTKPVPETPELIESFYEQVRQDACVKVHTYAPITQQLTSSTVTDVQALQKAGAIAFTNDGVGVQDAKTMWDAMKAVAKLDGIVAAHAEDDALKNHGVVHLGNVSGRLDLPGISSLSESTQVARDVLLAKDSNCRYHVCHVSSAETVEVIRFAKKLGIRVSAEVAPHHLLLSEDDIIRDDANFKMNPPLRGKADQEALIEGLLDGTLDCIATDHAPHTAQEKAQGLLKAPFGIIGLEYAFALLYTRFVLTQRFTLAQLIRWMTQAPAETFGLGGGSLAIGQRADVACFDLKSEVTIASFVSKSSNSPFIGRKVQGDCVLTLVDGNVVWRKNP